MGPRVTPTVPYTTHADVNLVADVHKVSMSPWPRPTQHLQAIHPATEVLDSKETHDVTLGQLSSWILLHLTES